MCDFRQNFWNWIGHSEDNGIFCHFQHHFRFQNIACRQSQENIRIGNNIHQGTFVSILGIFFFFRIHQFLTAFIDHALDVGDPDVFNRKSQIDQQFQTAQSTCTCTRHNHFAIPDILADDFQGIQNSCSDDDSRTMLIIVENRNIHSFPQFSFNIEAFRRADVFKIDTTESRFQGSNDIAQFFRIQFVDFQIENVDVGKFFEKNALTFHNRFGGLCSDIAKAQDGSAV